LYNEYCATKWLYDDKGIAFMEILPFDKKFVKDFVSLNRTWIEKYFVMESVLSLLFL